MRLLPDTMSSKEFSNDHQATTAEVQLHADGIVTEDEGSMLSASERGTTATVDLPYVDPNSLCSSPNVRPSPSPRKKATPLRSDFFDSSKTEKMSGVKFPALTAARFGLAQEQYAQDPFKLLVIVLFLNKTRGIVSVPLCRKLFAKYPSPESLASANLEDLTSLIRPLGLHRKRAQMLIDLGREWLSRPPQKGKRYRHLNYPAKGDGLDVPKEPISDADRRVAWEIAHLPTVGAYALDSWRIFCRDQLRDIPSDMGELGSETGMEAERKQEWTSVKPADKELKAYIKWRWLRLGYLWDPSTGHRLKIGLDILRKMESGLPRNFRGIPNPWRQDSLLEESLRIDSSGYNQLSEVSTDVGSLSEKRCREFSRNEPQGQSEKYSQDFSQKPSRVSSGKHSQGSFDGRRDGYEGYKFSLTQ